MRQIGTKLYVSHVTNSQLKRPNITRSTCILNIDLLVDELSNPNVCDGGGVVSQEVNVWVDDVHVAIVTKSFH